VLGFTGHGVGIPLPSEPTAADPSVDELSMDVIPFAAADAAGVGSRSQGTRRVDDIGHGTRPWSEAQRAFCFVFRYNHKSRGGTPETWGTRSLIDGAIRCFSHRRRKLDHQLFRAAGWRLVAGFRRHFISSSSGFHTAVRYS